MSAKIIAVVNQKGGSGKTTVSMSLAGTLGIRGLQVLVVDADIQGTASRWSSTAPEDHPFPALVVNLASSNNKLHEVVKKMVDKFDYVFIDCPPAADSPVSQSALVIAHLALVPVIPSAPDLWAALRIKELIQGVKNTYNPDLLARLVVNQFLSTTNLSKDVMDTLPMFEMPLFNTVLGFRNAFKEAAAFGKTVHDFGNPAEKAIAETISLTDEVVKLLS